MTPAQCNKQNNGSGTIKSKVSQTDNLGANCKMMFRRAVDEEESASDWDDLSPQGSPKTSIRASPGAQSPLPPSVPSGGSALPRSHGLVQDPLIVDDKIKQYYTSTSLSYNEKLDIQGPPKLGVATHHFPHPPTQLMLPSVKGIANRQTSSEIELAGLSRRAMFTPSPNNSDTLPRQEPRVPEEVEKGLGVPISGVPTPYPMLVARSHDHKSLYQVAREGRMGEEESKKGVVEDGGGGGGMETDVLEVRRSVDDVDVMGHDDLRKHLPRLDLEFSVVSAESANFLSPSHQRPHAYMSNVATRWEKMSARGIEEVCSTFRLITDLLLTIFLGSVHCFLYHILRKCICGLGHIFADSLYKPALTLCFNGFMWPSLSVVVQLSKGLVLVIGPLLEAVGVVFSWVAHMCRACRLVNLTYKNYRSPSSNKPDQTQNI